MRGGDRLWGKNRCFVFYSLPFHAEQASVCWPPGWRIRIHSIDHAIISAVQGWENPALTGLMKFFTMMGEGLSVAVIGLGAMAILYYRFRLRRELLLFAEVVLGSALMNLLLKLMFQRARPVLHRMIEVKGFSFPSGHAMAAFSLYGILAFLFWKHVRGGYGRALLLGCSGILIVGIGLSRIYLGVHYPSDVLGGYMASACWLGASILM